MANAIYMTLLHHNTVLEWYVLYFIPLHLHISCRQLRLKRLALSRLFLLNPAHSSPVKLKDK